MFISRWLAWINACLSKHLVSQFAMNLDRLRLPAAPGSMPTIGSVHRSTADADVLNAQARLWSCSRDGDEVGMGQSLRQGADVNASDPGGFSALHWSAAAGEWSACDLLLRRGARIDAFDHDGKTPLDCALRARHVDVAMALIEAGASSNRSDLNGTTPTHLAARLGHVPLLTALLSRGARIDALDLMGCQPIHLAVSAGHEDAALWLLNASAPLPAPLPATCAASAGASLAAAPSPTAPTALTLLHRAAAGGLLVLAKALLQGDPRLEVVDACDARDARGNTPLHLAALEGQDALIDLLLCHRAFTATENATPGVGLTNLDGRTPLHLSALGGHADACLGLLARGADPHALDRDGRTPKGLARDNGQFHVIAAMDVFVARGPCAVATLAS